MYIGRYKMSLYVYACIHMLQVCYLAKFVSTGM